MSGKHYVVYNACYGGFRLSEDALALLSKKKGYEVSNSDIDSGDGECDGSIMRHDPDLVAVVRELGEEDSSGQYTKLCVMELQGSQYMIEEYDGVETVYTPETTQWVNIE